MRAVRFMASATELEKGATPGPCHEPGGSSEIASFADTATTESDTDELMEMVKQPWGIVTSFFWSISSCLSLLLYNTVIIFSGHLILRYIPIPANLLPSRRPFVVSRLTPTLGIAALGTAVLAIPVFATAMVVVGFVVGIKMKSLVTLKAVIRLDHALRSSRLAPPHPETLFWHVWMVAAGPVGSLLYDILFPSSKNHLSMVETTIAAAIPRALWLGIGIARSGSRGAGVQPADVAIAAAQQPEFSDAAAAS
ncbi:hypothetical protein K466DRAFT_656782, partial [Polyporus arcularius HHB13444]